MEQRFGDIPNGIPNGINELVGWAKRSVNPKNPKRQIHP